MALDHDLMTNVVVVLSFAAALSAVFYYALSRPSPLRVHRSRSRRSISRDAHHAMISFPWRNLRHYSPTHVLLQVDYSSPIGYYCPFVTGIIPLYSAPNSDPYGPHSIQIYTPPPKAAPCMIPLSTVLPIEKMYYTSFMNPSYSDPYGPTAVQLYSAYKPKPLQRGSNMSEAICLGENQCEAPSFGNQLSHSALPTASNDPSLLCALFFPILGLLITTLLLGITLCASAMYFALRREDRLAREGDYDEAQENVSDLSSIEHLSSHEQSNMERDNGEYKKFPGRKDNHLKSEVDGNRKIDESRYERPEKSKENKKPTSNAKDQVRAKHSETYEEHSSTSPRKRGGELKEADQKMLSEILPYASRALSSGHDTICSLEVIEELASQIDDDIIYEILYDMVPPTCHSYGGGYLWKCKESPDICKVKSSLSREKRKILEHNICPDCGSEFTNDLRSPP